MTTIRDAKSSDLLYVDSLRKKEGDALGFIPMAVYQSIAERITVANRNRFLYQKLMVTQDNDDLTGFCLGSFFDEDKARIYQIVVQQDARRWQRAKLMCDAVESNAIRLGKKFVVARVACDLESVLFWNAIGYRIVAQTTSTWLNQKESLSKRPLFIFEKQVSNSLFEIDSFPVMDRQNTFSCKPSDIQVANIQLEFPLFSQDINK